MEKRILIAIVAGLCLVMCWNCKKADTEERNKDNTEQTENGNIVTIIKFDGGSCELYSMNKNPMFAPSNMQQGEKAFELALKYSLNNSDETDKLSVLSKDGEFIAPNGNRYKAGAATLKTNESIYSLFVAIPVSIDAGTLQFVYNNQVMLLQQ